MWRVVDPEGAVLEGQVTKRRYRTEGVKFLGKTMKRLALPCVILADLLPSDGAALQVLGNADKQQTGCWVHNRVENSHQSSNHERHRDSQTNFKRDRTAALTELRDPDAAKGSA